jgi:ParB-like chromosome segregation protein Spo0J
MATKINAGDDVKRGDFFWVDPTEVIVREELRGRQKPPTEADIISMAESLMDHGQRQPVECRKIENNRLLLNMGFTRTAAARLIRTGFIGTEGSERRDENFKLKVILSDGNDKDAFIHNIVENAHRNNTTAIDDAYNHNRLREQYGYNDAQITRLYRYDDPNKVGRYRKLLNLNPDVQNLVADGSLAVQAAIDLLDMPEDKHAEVLAAATVTKADGTIKVQGSAIRQQVRSHHLNDDGNDDGTDDPSTDNNGNSDATVAKKKAKKKGSKDNSGLKPLSMREIRKFFEAQSDSENQVDPGIQAFSKSMLAWMAGKVGDKSMGNALNKLADYERE